MIIVLDLLKTGTNTIGFEFKFQVEIQILGKYNYKVLKISL
jgi:hypothetical protein